MTLQLEENELRELRLAISSRIVIIDGLIRRAAKKDRAPLNEKRALNANLYSKLTQLEDP
jgi:hypothetical protein